jgi:catechol 2,3-dioxygenase-like lactoylglutathione lyase family enzyme
MEGMVMRHIDLPEIGHVGYIVGSADACARLFDAKYTRVYDFIPTRAWAYGKPLEGCKLRIALYSPEVGAKLELVEPLSAEGTPMQDFFRECGENIHHIAYYVNNYDEIRSYFAALEGAKIIFEAEIEDEVMGKRSSFYVKVPDFPGVVEISKRPTKL